MVLDLKGRTLIPGIIEPHSHMYGRAVQYLDRLGFKYPPEGVLVTSATADPNSLEKTQAIMRDAIKDASPRWNPESGSFCNWDVILRKHPSNSACGK